MTDVRQCPACGAQNAASAEWCTLCLTRFPDAPMPSREPSGDELADELAAIAGSEPPTAPRRASKGNGTQKRTEPVADAATAAEPGNGHGVEVPSLPAVDQEALGAEPPAPVRQTRVRMLKDGDRVRWVCPVCGTMNDIEASACRICGTVMASLFRPEPSTPPPVKSSRQAVAMAAALPGLGQAYLGAVAAGVSRAGLFVWTLFIAILFLAHPPPHGGGLLRAIGALFALGAIAVWVLSFVETRRYAEGGPPTAVDSRTVTWSAVALIVVLFVGLTLAAFARR